LTSADVLRPGPYAVGVATYTFEDPSRPTMANGTYPGATSRVLDTEVWYPIDPRDAGTDLETRGAPVMQTGRTSPLIIYSHGFMSMRTGGANLARHLATYGYVVAAPDFPLTTTAAPGGPNVLDLANQPGDVRFVIDRMLALETFAAVIDPARIGLTGLSLGGSTTLLTAFHPTMHDPRIRAAAPMAPGGCFMNRTFYGDRVVPLLVVHGDIDAITPYEANGVRPFSLANPPTYLATLINGTHTAFTHGANVIFENQNNADDLGCRALGAGDDLGDSTFLDRLGGAEAGIGGDCPALCPLPRNPRAMRPSRQLQATMLSIVPFFDAMLKGDARARAFLERTLAAENADVTVQARGTTD
jgi:predicted dienelactone hydrolase